MRISSLLIAIILCCFGCANEAEQSTNTETNENAALPHSGDLPDTELTEAERKKLAQAQGKTVGYTNFSELEKRFQSDNDTLYIINFWATWCGPCVEEMPYFEKVADDFTNKKVKLIFVSMDNPKILKERVIPFVREKQIRSEVVLLNEKELSQTEWINRIDKDWEGEIPATLFMNNRSETRLFYSKGFSYEELEAIVNPLVMN